MTNADEQAEPGAPALGQHQADEQDQDQRRGHHERTPSRSGSDRDRPGCRSPTASAITSGPTMITRQRIGQAQRSTMARSTASAGSRTVPAAGVPGAMFSSASTAGDCGGTASWIGRQLDSDLIQAIDRNRERRRRPSRRPEPPIRRGSGAGCATGGRRSRAPIHSHARLIAGRRSSACNELIATRSTMDRRPPRRPTTIGSATGRRSSPAAMARPATISSGEEPDTTPPRPHSPGPARWSHKRERSPSAAVRPRATRRMRSPSVAAVAAEVGFVAARSAGRDRGDRLELPSGRRPSEG